jgi:hypothetical protein
MAVSAVRAGVWGGSVMLDYSYIPRRGCTAPMTKVVLTAARPVPPLRGITFRCARNVMAVAMAIPTINARMEVGRVQRGNSLVACGVGTPDDGYIWHIGCSYIS